MNWLAVGISMFATSFSSISFLGLPQRGAYQDFSFYLTILLILLLITPLLWFFFVPLYVRLQVSSGYAYLGQRFNATVQRIGARAAIELRRSGRHRHRERPPAGRTAGRARRRGTGSG